VFERTTWCESTVLISICIPHYNRVQHLLVVLDSIVSQDYSDIEVIISDDCSVDDSSKVIPEYIVGSVPQSRIRFTYIRQLKNLGYDGNLRAALAAAQGEYLFILGNDDALAKPTTITRLATIVRELGLPDIAFTNFHTYGRENEVARRAADTRLFGAGPNVAARNYRSFSFVGGVVIKRSAFELHDTDGYNGSIYIQIYLAARIISAGGNLASIAESMVAKDVVVGGKAANSYMDTLASNNSKITPRTGGLDQVGIVACDAILPYVLPSQRGKYLFLIYYQIFAFTYPVWLFAYRKQGVFRAALNLALGCFPPRLILVREVPFFVHVRLLLLYLGTTFFGLLLPVWLLENLKPYAYKFSKILLKTA